MNNIAAFLLPVSNAANTISTTLDSLLSQDYSNFKIYIINNGSTDNTLDIIKSYIQFDSRIVVHSLSSACLTASLCYGIKVIKEEIILRIDSGDLCRSNRLSSSINFMNMNPNVDIIYSNYSVNVDGNLSNTQLPSQVNRVDLVFKNLLAHSSLCFRRSSLLKSKFDYSGLFGKTSFYGPSQDLLLLSIAKYNFDFNIKGINKNLVEIVKSDLSISSKQKIYQRINASCIMLINSFRSLNHKEYYRPLLSNFFSLIINSIRIIRYKKGMILLVKLFCRMLRDEDLDSEEFDYSSYLLMSKV